MFPDAKPRICVSPDAGQWNIGVVGTQRKIFALAMYISYFLCRFHLHLVANANPVSGGIWALETNGRMLFELLVKTTLSLVS